MGLTLGVGLVLEKSLDSCPRMGHFKEQEISGRAGWLVKRARWGDACAVHDAKVQAGREFGLAALLGAMYTELKKALIR